MEEWCWGFFRIGCAVVVMAWLFFLGLATTYLVFAWLMGHTF